jgi:hypothetical protein
VKNLNENPLICASHLGRNIYERLKQEPSLKTGGKQCSALIATYFHAVFFFA